MQWWSSHQRLLYTCTLHNYHHFACPAPKNVITIIIGTFATKLTQLCNKFFYKHWSPAEKFLKETIKIIFGILWVIMVLSSRRGLPIIFIEQIQNLCNEVMQIWSDYGVGRSYRCNNVCITIRIEVKMLIDLILCPWNFVVIFSRRDTPV